MADEEPTDGTEAAAAASAEGEQPNDATAPSGDASDVVGQQDINVLLEQAEQALASIDKQGENLPAGISSFQFQRFSGSPANEDHATLELLRDVELDLKIELGRTRMELEDVLQLRKGAVVTLDKLAGDPVDVYVNGRLIARGEVLVLNDNFCVRVTELMVGESACA